MRAVLACAAAAVAGLSLAGVPPTAVAAPTGLVLGTALPDTGSLREYGPATQAAVRLAVQDINAAGGVAGTKVTLYAGNSGDVDARVFAGTVDRLREKGVHALVGPLSSDLLLDNLDEVSGLTVISPAAMSDRLTGKAYRVVPPESMQGGVLATLAVEDGVRRLAIVARNSSRAAAEEAARVAREAGIPRRIVSYPDRTSRLQKFADEVTSYRPDSIVFVSGPETGNLLSLLLRQGIPTRLYFGATAGAAAADGDLPRGTLQGAKMVDVDLRVDGYFGDQIEALAPKAPTLEFSPQAYQATVILALAAEQAAREGDITAQAIADNIPAVTSGGRRCQSAATCLVLISQGIDIAYDGPLGPLPLKANGNPASASFAISTFGSGNKPFGRPRYVRWP